MAISKVELAIIADIRARVALELIITKELIATLEHDVRCECGDIGIKGICERCRLLKELKSDGETMTTDSKCLKYKCLDCDYCFNGPRKHAGEDYCPNCHSGRIFDAWGATPCGRKDAIIAERDAEIERLREELREARYLLRESRGANKQLKSDNEQYEKIVELVRKLL